MKNRLFILVLLAFPFVVSAADGVHEHDGFYLRLTTGIGYSSLFEDESFSGMSGITTIGIGGAVAENLIINADLYGSVAKDPEYSATDIALDGSMNFYGFGVGATYYFMPVNVYVTGSLGAGYVSFDIDGSDEDLSSDWGFSMNFAAGKEWWVSDNWGLGVAGQFFYNPKVGDGSSSFIGGGVLFTATYN